MTAARPLEGRCVVELCQNVAGPYAGLVLGQLGARVIKVERPGDGDDTRQWTPANLDRSPMFATMNAGKESICLDLDDEADRERLWVLLGEADVVVRSWRPGALERRGFGWDELSERLPALVCCTITAFGTEGPKSDEPGYDPLIQAFSGLMSTTGHPGQEPVRVGTSIIDMGTGMWGVVGTLAALTERERTGRGSHVETSLFATGLAWLPYQLAAYLATGEQEPPLGSGHPLLAPYQAFATADGPLVVAAGNDRLWTSLCEAIGRDDLAGDPDFATNPDRVSHRERLVTELAETFAERPRGEWAERLAAAGLPCAEVNDLGEVLDHPQTIASGMVVPPVDGEFFRRLALPLALDGARVEPRGPAPELGDHRGAPDGTVSDRTGS